MTLHDVLEIAFGLSIVALLVYTVIYVGWLLNINLVSGENWKTLLKKFFGKK